MLLCAPEPIQGGCGRNEAQGALSGSSPSFARLLTRDAPGSGACASRLAAQL